ncbi:N-acetylmuramoyl-L-alanine amidase [Lutibacter sp. TH_r2]|uniref:N-acetylmuramoyl-L-alanine amidase family protein n=1 Tax=Lutibacter sp. TH_r2 TaxID=3082083 RepID=UPI0029530A0D|nr:N-acetylmuramoyl-L-alanine amidase [Lutibacter sp. TH_r2]MDV7187143.1 N-acetylmuramoyl-L-alanine amidase [Lutibacter sp. TH_r2]
MNSQHFSKIKTRTKIFTLFVLFGLLILSENNVYSQTKKYVVVLDAGHGGKDPGKVGYKNAKEKDIALNIVLKVGKILEKESNIKVIYTRKTDVFVDLWERGRIANKADANLFVSVHCNSHTSQAYGSETWVLGTHANSRNFEVAKAENSVILLEDNHKVNYKGFDPKSPESIIGLTLMQEEYLDQSIQLASIIQDGFTYDLKRKNRGVKQAGFVVLHQTYMPSILIETGFISNKSEGAYLNTEKGKLKFSESIAKGIKKYLNQLDINAVTTEKKSVEEITETKTENIIETVDTSVKFKVQIASGTRKLTTKSYNFKGLQNIERVKVGNSYKYYLGNTSNYNEVKDLQKLAKSKGYTSAFIVAFNKGVKVPVSQVIKKS